MPIAISDGVSAAGGWHKRGADIGFVVAAAIALLLAQSFQPLLARLAVPLGRWLEAFVPGPVAHPPTHIDGIVVLGGSQTRAREALRLAALHPQATLILTGPGEDELALMRAHPELTHRLRVEGKARNTFENAKFSRDLAQPRTSECWAMVTSAIHMPRALAVFNALEFSVVPWPVMDTPVTAPALTQSVWHEIVGLVAYRLLGRTRELMPNVTSFTCGAPEIWETTSCRRICRILSLYRNL